MPDLSTQNEKKVEYVELIYDLMFVYVIGRNNTIAGHLKNGFIDPETYLTYILCTLITIQIWYTTTIFINRHGSNSPAEYAGLFINMYLLYYMADATRLYWQGYYYRYNTAWLLIILNLAIQYYIKYRRIKKEVPWEKFSVKWHVYILLIQAGLIAAGMLGYRFTGIPFSLAALIFGMIFSVIANKKDVLVAIDFSHLTERIMLYIVFTFGEMIIVIASYFTGEITASGIYFSVMAFLIVVGLFMSYGYIYDHLLDREMHVNGNNYMFIHIFIIFALSNLTLALEFMHETEVSAVPKNIFLIVSFVMYFLFLFMTIPYTKKYDRNIIRIMPFFALLGIFTLLMLLFYKSPYISIALSVLLPFTFRVMVHRYRKGCQKGRFFLSHIQMRDKKNRPF